jgi:nucleoid-associated protein YgaU
MNRNVGASFTLSVLLVVFFAVVLYQPDAPRTPRAATAPAVPSEAHPPEAPAAVGAPSSSNHAGLEVREVARQIPLARPETSVATNARQTESRAPEPVHPIVFEPRGVFTVVRDGETLADVARRVYGGQFDANSLWTANRDVLDREDSPLRPGTMLRTP